MAEELARLAVVLDARIDQFERKVTAAERRYSRAAKQIATDTAEVDRTVQRLGSADGYRKIGAAAQQAGYQVGDFATQVASGGNPIVALTQQGAQLLGMFGPWGAVLGAAGAIVGALAISLGGASDEAENLELSTGGLESAVRDVEAAAVAYADAISATASAQGSASDSIVADTKREFEAKKALLELEIKRQQALQAERQGRVTALTGELSSRDFSPAAGRGIGRAGIERFAEGQKLRDELKQLTAEATLAEIAIDKALAAANAPFSVTAAGARGGGGGRRSSGGGGGGSEFGRIADEAREIDRLVNQVIREGAEANAELARAQQESARAAEAQTRAFESVANSITSAALSADSFEEGLQKIGLQLLNLGVQGLFGAGPLAGALSGAVNGINIPGILPQFAAGTDFAPGGMALVGERGPELVNLPRGAQVTPNHRLAEGMGGSSIVVNIMAQDVNSFRASRGQVAAELARAVRVGSGRL